MKNQLRRPTCLFAVTVSLVLNHLATSRLLAGHPIAGIEPPPASTSADRLAAITKSAANSRNPLVWDSMEKTVSPKIGDEKAEFTFWVTNTSNIGDVTVNELSPSCGCTTPQTEVPWKLAPGSSGPMKATVDIKGKSGQLTKTITVDSTAGSQVLTLHINVPSNPAELMAQRKNNMEQAKNDPQAIFKGNCAECHFVPTVGKMGEELYVTGCAICHEPDMWGRKRNDPAPHHRAEMVPDLVALKQSLDRATWKAIISNGKPNTLMAAFAESSGGVLSDHQIETLLDYVTKRFSVQSVQATSAGDRK